VTVVLLRSAESAQGPGLLLRPWAAEDTPGLLEIFRDPVMRQSWRNPVVTDRDAGRWLEVQQQGWTDGRRLSFAVAEVHHASDSGRVVGNVVLKGWEAGKYTAEVGYWTAAAARKRGIASQAVEMLTAWAFETFGPRGLQRLDLIHQVDNLASCRVAQKSGYALIDTRPANPPDFRRAGHLHTRSNPPVVAGPA
jgi:RimJ/RimL family protein N-acetyltransferase